MLRNRDGRIAVRLMTHAAGMDILAGSTIRPCVGHRKDAERGIPQGEDCINADD
jgi:hypothetical protein